MSKIHKYVPFIYSLMYSFIDLLFPYLLQNTEIDPTLFTIIRSAFIGLCASSLSDVCSNSLRVLKTVKQTNRNDVETINKDIGIDKDEEKNKAIEIESNSLISNIDNLANDAVDVLATQLEIENKKIVTKMDTKSYLEIAKDIIAVEGLGGLFGRGLQVKIVIDFMIFMLASSSSFIILLL